MAAILGQSADRRTSPNSLGASLSSNNPFRNSDSSRDRAASPTKQLPLSPTSPFEDPSSSQRPVSRNPFLDPANRTNQGAMATTDKAPAAKPEELFDGLTLDDKAKPPAPAPKQGMLRPPPMGRGGPPRGGGGPLSQHRPSRSQEEALRARRPRPARPGDATSPPRRMMPGPRPRRNSESSILDEKLTEEEKKARDARRRERERRHREAKNRPKEPSKRMDTIDRLDATGIYGMGMFHHDGPFDAATAHRNQKGVRRAPLEAFPKDSLNMSLGGPGPLNKRANHDTFMGHANDEAFTDYSTGSTSRGEFNQLRPKGEIPTWDPTARGSIVHGEQTVGLGTSTFLEGTPAARSAVQKKEQEGQDGGLQRKKSLAQRIRGMNRAPRPDYQSGPMTNPDGAYRDVASAGPSTGTREANPFFAEYDNKKGGEQITVRKMSGSGQISPPLPGLERRATADAYGDSSDSARAGKSGGGLLGRVKSLKGGSSRPRKAEAGQAVAGPSS